MSVSVYNNGELTPVAGQLLPAKTASFAGQIVMGANISTPAGWLKCDGTGYSKSDYIELYAAIGDTYNKPGTPSGYFCVPDMRGRYALGYDGSNSVGREIEESLPNIRGEWATKNASGSGEAFGVVSNGDSISGALYKASAYSSSKRTQSYTSSSYSGTGNLGFDASKTSSGNGKAYKDGAKVRPDSLVLNYYIKY